MPTEEMWNDAREAGRYLGPVDPTPPGFRPEGESVIARTWKIVLAQGLTWIAFGFLVLAWPDLGLETLVALIAACAFFHGAISGAAAFAVPLRRRGRAWLVLDALTAVVIGVVVLAWPDISATSVLYVLAAWAIALGVLQMIGAHVLAFSGERATLLAWSGVVPVIFGVVMLLEAGEGALAHAALIAAFGIVTGVLQIAFALDLRQVPRRVP
jgi:uncharacterized membrane protein HdeD (DUF308 family)